MTPKKLGVFDISDLKTIVRTFTDEDWNADASRQAAFNAHIATQTIKLIADTDFRHTDPTYHPMFRQLEPQIRPLMDHIQGFFLQTLRQRGWPNRTVPDISCAPC